MLCFIDIRSHYVRAAVVLTVLLAWPGVISARKTAHTAPGAPETPAAASGLTLGDWDESSLRTIDEGVFNLALGAANCAVRSGTMTELSTLTVIDYSKPSTAKRLWVFDVRSRTLLFEELVAHGQGSGSNVATLFSNEPDTHQSSIGLFQTQDTYIGKNGYSLRLKGLDQGFNDHALQRAIVMHGAPYVSDEFAHAQGRLGRSWGCPALREAIARELIDRVKNTGLVFAYYPDQRWLTSSKYLGNCQ